MTLIIWAVMLVIYFAALIAVIHRDPAHLAAKALAA